MKNQKIIIILLVLTLLITVTSCSASNKYSNGFFAWMDAYIAVEKGTSNVIAVTMFYKEVPFKSDDIASIEFLGIDNKIITINSFSIDNSKQTSNVSNKKYSSYSITLNYTPNEIGTYRTSGVRITFKSNKVIDYPVGKWIFEINRKSPGYIDAWNSPVASNNGNEFTYAYLSLNSTYIIAKIYYGANLYIANKNGLQVTGKIDMKNCYSAPIVYIKSKIIASNGEGDKTDFGKGCYCGAIGFSEDVIKSSEKHNSIK